MIVREAVESREAASLAPWAMLVAASRGREHQPARDPWRTDYQRDRDRIVHSRAFRRLQYKTQVFVNDEGDHFRTRLTHTIEVAQVARTAARRLGLNEDLVECVALVHDLGHPPFGHQGETMLAELMATHGGFEHNLQTLRIVDDLELRYPEHPGLDLTYEVRESIVKHSAHYDRSRVPDGFRPEESPLLEAQLVDELDAVAYDCHDIDDGLRGGYISLDQLAEVPIWRGCWREAVEASPRSAPQRLIIDRALRQLLDALLGNLVETTAANLADRRIADVAAVRAAAGPLVGFAPTMQPAKRELERWLFANLYRHHLVNRTFHRAKGMLADLFRFYSDHPDSLPPEFAARIPAHGPERTIADWIAGMTDRFALDEHRALFGG